MAGEGCFKWRQCDVIREADFEAQSAQGTDRHKVHKEEHPEGNLKVNLGQEGKALEHQPKKTWALFCRCEKWCILVGRGGGEIYCPD